MSHYSALFSSHLAKAACHSAGELSAVLRGACGEEWFFLSYALTAHSLRSPDNDGRYVSPAFASFACNGGQEEGFVAPQ
jgi:hypothetical protein